MREILTGSRVEHPIYGEGKAVSDPQTFNTHQFSGSAVWCVFFNPKTGIASGWPYCVPTLDLTNKGTS